VTRLYQLLLGLIWTRGIMTVPAKQVNQKDSVLNRAHARGYVNIDERPRKIPEAVQHKIGAIIGKAPRWIYA
jgi:adenylate kinase